MANLKTPISGVIGAVAEFHGRMSLAPDKTVNPKAWHDFRDEALDILKTRFEAMDVAQYFDFAE